MLQIVAQLTPSNKCLFAASFCRPLLLPLVGFIVNAWSVFRTQSPDSNGLRNIKMSRSSPRSARKLALSLLLGTFALATPGQMAHAIEPDLPDTTLTAHDGLINAIQAEMERKVRIRDGYEMEDRRRKEVRALDRFYEQRGFSPIWVKDNRLTPRARAVIALISGAARYGLQPGDYNLPAPDALDQLADRMIDDRLQAIARTEVQMSKAVLHYASDVSGGRIDPSKYTKHIDRRGRFVKPEKVLTVMADPVANPTAWLDSLQPNHPQYRLLVRELARIRGDDTVPQTTGSTSQNQQVNIRIPRGPSIRPGEIHPHIRLIRKRLGIPARDGDEPLLYDAALVEAVQKFQMANNLNPDGIIGRMTRKAMNGERQHVVTPRKRLQTILVNLERWRWMPRTLGRKYVLSNIPEFTVRVIKDGRVIHKERIVVGKRTNKTPVFSDEMEQVVFNPYWYVPQSIIWTEMHGRIPRGYEGEWRNGMLHVRQPPGPGNALGRIKFDFPNKHAVYMHDTPLRRLFNRSRRAFSHGCMRVRNPKRLAEVIFQDEPGWNKKKVASYYHSGASVKVKLKKKVPVHVVYFTAWSENGRTLKFFRDLYGHDDRIAMALHLKPGDPYRVDPVEAAARARAKERERRNKQRDRYDNYYNNSPGNVFDGIFGWLN